MKLQLVSQGINEQRLKELISELTGKTLSESQEIIHKNLIFEIDKQDEDFYPVYNLFIDAGALVRLVTEVIDSKPNQPTFQEVPKQNLKKYLVTILSYNNNNNDIIEFLHVTTRLPKNELTELLQVLPASFKIETTEEKRYEIQSDFNKLLSVVDINEITDQTIIPELETIKTVKIQVIYKIELHSRPIRLTEAIQLTKELSTIEESNCKKIVENTPSEFYIKTEIPIADLIQKLSQINAEFSVTQTDNKILPNPPYKYKEIAVVEKEKITPINQPERKKINTINQTITSSNTISYNQKKSETNQEITDEKKYYKYSLYAAIGIAVFFSLINLTVWLPRIFILGIGFGAGFVIKKNLQSDSKKHAFQALKNAAIGCFVFYVLTSLYYGYRMLINLQINYLFKLIFYQFFYLGNLIFIALTLITAYYIVVKINFSK